MDILDSSVLSVRQGRFLHNKELYAEASDNKNNKGD